MRRSPGHAISRIPRAVGAALLLTAVFVAPGLSHTTPAKGAVEINVNSPADVVDATPGDGACETAQGNGVCTLRAAVQETNALAGADTINLQGITYTLSIPGTDETASVNGDLNVNDDLTIIGESGSTVDGNGGVTGERVFWIAQGKNVTLSGLTMVGGRSEYGGGLNNRGVLTLDRVTMTNNIANGQASVGGAIDTSIGTLTITDSTISGNTATGYPGWGGGILGGDVTVRNSTISGNSAVIGGGLYSVSYLEVINSTISGNSALDAGGINTRGGAELVNSTISGNSATRNGGGIYSTQASILLLSTTVAKNIANSDASDPGQSVPGDGGALYQGPVGGDVKLLNTMLADNVAYVYRGEDEKYLKNPSNCAGTMDAHGYNIIEDSVGACTIYGYPYSNADPMLGSLQDNGGPTQTHAIPAASPAVDAGNPGGCLSKFVLGADPLTADQRGYARAGGSCDIGAFEYNGIAPATPTPTPSSTPSPTVTASVSSTPTVTPSITPTTPTPTGSSARKQGDLTCDGKVDAIDALKAAANGAGLGTSSPGSCPIIGSGDPPFGSTNCDTKVDATDAIQILQYAATVPIKPPQPGGCTALGQLLPS